MRREIDVTAFLKDLEQLVNIDSGTRCPEGTAKIAKFLAKKYANMGWSVQSHCFDSSVGPCLEITNNTRDAFDVLLIGHMDTVFPSGTAAERPFTVRGARASGPGVNDMKAGLLLMYYALKALQEAGLPQQASICVALNSDEEIGSKYSRTWLEGLAKKSHHAIILEPARTNGALVQKRKGGARFTIDITGVAAHAGVEPEKGRSAIEEMAHWVLALHSLTNYQVGTTVNVGTISAGTAPNVIAANAKAEVDLRFSDMAEATNVAATIQELAARPKTPGVTTKVTGGVTRPPMNPSEQSLQFCRKVEEIGAQLGINIEWAATGGGSDGNFSAALGVPTIDGMGPIGGGSHSIEEYLEINSIEPRFRLLCEIIAQVVAK